MIFVDRSKIKAPDILTVAGREGLTEQAEAIKHFTAPLPHGKFKFEVYRHEDVKTALITLFNKKCAYCETRILAGYPGDVEHFRPKAEITEAIAPIAPGYYWLGADWDNLLLACKLCNTHKTHEVHGQDNKQVLGKMNQFPLHNFPHVRSHLIGTATEEPHRLLIDPCKDDPEQHLSYRDDGSIKPRVNLSGGRSAKGERSINVYALQRIDLVDERKLLRIEIALQQDRVLEAALNFLEFIDVGTPAQILRFENRAKLEMLKLKAYKEPDRQYSAMAKEMIDTFLEENYDYFIPKVV